MDERSFFEPILSLFRESVKRVPALRFLYGIIALLFVYYLIVFLKLGDYLEVLRGLLVILGMAFLTFLFSIMTNVKDKAIRYLVYGILFIFSLCICAYIVMITYYQVTGNSNKFTNLFKITETSKPYFYSSVEINQKFGHFKDSTDNSIFTENISDFNFFINQSAKNDLSLISFNSFFDVKEKGNLDVKAMQTIILKSNEFVGSGDSLSLRFYSVVEKINKENFSASFVGRQKLNEISGNLKIEFNKDGILYYVWEIPLTLLR